ncbi:MAG: beta-N-acetylhexosaminidase [Thermodesulfobacteriota bacterium]
MSLSLADLGSLFMAGLPGYDLDDSTRYLIDKYGVNHFIFFKRNVESEAQLSRLSKDLIGYCRKKGLAEPLISIDQEGGTVARLPEPFVQFADARVYADGPDARRDLQEYARLCGRDLQKVGVNMNFAPVLDVCPHGQGCFMEHRSLGADPQRVAELGVLIIDAFQNKGIAACAKHFPGLGEAVIDPHLHLPVVSDSWQKIKDCDLLPFQAAIKAGVASVMTSHVLYQDIDPENLATFSSKILTDLLRHQLGYDGMVVTDDLEMGAVENDIGVPEASVRAFKAGVDLLLICHDHGKVKEAVSLLHQAYLNKEVSKERLQQSFLRINKVSGCFLRNGA